MQLSVEEETSSGYQKKEKLRDGTQTTTISSLGVKTTKKEEPFMQPADHKYNRFSSSDDEAEDAAASMREGTEERKTGSTGRSSNVGGGFKQADENQRGILTRQGSPEEKADDWEKSTMAKIRERYEKKESNILAWENEEKMKAKLEMERKKRELEQQYQNKMARIDTIGEKARVKIEEKRRNEEYEVKKKEKRVISKAKAPYSCFCF